MSLMVDGGCRNVDSTHPRGGYQEPFVVIAPIFNHKNGHYVRPNRVGFKYPNFKKDVDPYAHVKVFNFAVKSNEKTFEEYIINVFSSMLRNTTLDWRHYYMLEFPNYLFQNLHRHFANVIGRLRMMNKYIWS